MWSVVVWVKEWAGGRNQERLVAQREGSGAKNSAIGSDARDVTGDH